MLISFFLERIFHFQKSKIEAANRWSKMIIGYKTED